MRWCSRPSASRVVERPPAATSSTEKKREHSFLPGTPLISSAASRSRRSPAGTSMAHPVEVGAGHAPAAPCRYSARASAAGGQSRPRRHPGSSMPSTVRPSGTRPVAAVHTAPPAGTDRFCTPRGRASACRSSDATANTEPADAVEQQGSRWCRSRPRAVREVGCGGVVRGGRALLVWRSALRRHCPALLLVFCTSRRLFDQAGRRGTAAQEQAAGCPVVDVKAAAGKGGRSIQTVGAPGGIEKFLIAGHGTGQGELLEEVVVSTAQVEHQRQRPGGRDSQVRSRASARPARRRCFQGPQTPPRRGSWSPPGTSAGKRTQNPRR